MATYPIKMLRDEQGQPFVPLTHIKAVTGIQSYFGVLTAERVTAGHYNITNSDFTIEQLKDNIVGIRWDSIGTTLPVTYIQVNGGIEYPVYQADGKHPLTIQDMGDAICLFTFTGDMWKLLKTMADNKTSGHIIQDETTVLPTRSILKFQGFEVSDNISQDATIISNINRVQKYTGVTGPVVLNTWNDLYNTDLKAQSKGSYRITINVKMTDINSVGNNIGVKFGTMENWNYQYNKYSCAISTIDDFEKGDSLVPQIWVDSITSLSSPSIQSCTFYIERLILE